VWTQGGYQVGREPDDYPLFLAVREQDVDAWETFFESFDLPTAFERQPQDELDGPLQIVLEPRASLDIEHVEGYPVILRAETIEYMRENYAQFQSGLAMLDRPDVRGPRPRRHVSRDRTGTAMSFNNRSDALIELLEELTQQGHEYVLVGGYAVSAFNARFSTDLDIVVAPDSKADFVEFLEQRGFEETDSHAKEWFYDTEVIEYEKRLTPQQPIGFDLPGKRTRVSPDGGTVVVRLPVRPQPPTGGESGGTVTTTARVIDGAVPVAAKLHSGRETDLRDVLAVAEEIDPTLSRHTCDEGTTMRCGSSLSVDWKSWRATNSSTDIGVTSGPQLSQKKRSPLSKSICLLRLTT